MVCPHCRPQTMGPSFCISHKFFFGGVGRGWDGRGEVLSLGGRKNAEVSQFLLVLETHHSVFILGEGLWVGEDVVGGERFFVWERDSAELSQILYHLRIASPSLYVDISTVPVKL